jgi:hypothetical protein
MRWNVAQQTSFVCVQRPVPAHLLRSRVDREALPQVRQRSQPLRRTQSLPEIGRNLVRPGLTCCQPGSDRSLQGFQPAGLAGGEGGDHLGRVRSRLGPEIGQPLTDNGEGQRLMPVQAGTCCRQPTRSVLCHLGIVGRTAPDASGAERSP